MSLEISRRNLLKGLMVSAGVAAVGIPMEVVEAAQPIIEAAPVRSLTVEFGDFWIRRDGMAHFIGKLTAVDMRCGYVEYFDGGDYLKCIPDNTIDVDASLFPDMEGYNLVYDAMAERSMIEAIFGHHGGSYVVRDAFLTQIQSRIGPHDLALQVSVFGRRGGVLS